jgi:exopolysaccharide biosynthesis polyprenyl glycosylphosphotransferase
VARNLFICSVVLVALEVLYGLVSPEPRPLNVLVNDCLLVLFYAVMHVLQYLWITHLSGLGFFRKNVMLVGTYDERLPVDHLFQDINNTKCFVGQMGFDGGAWTHRPDFQSAFVPVKKRFSDFLFSRKVNELLICIDGKIPPDAIRECAAWCLENSIGYYLIPDISSLPHVFPWHSRFTDIPSIERYCPNRDSLIMISLKRLLDIGVSSVALTLLSPVFLAIAALIKREDGGPVFYVSERVGIHGKTIPFVKFRSMVVDADSRKRDLLDLNERPDGPLFKLTNDPRVTRIGKILRKTSLDELPQLWNVLKGDMSLIGPRPHLPQEVEAYSDVDNLRLECIPGISCLPQIYGRDSLGFRQWVDYDLQYRKEWSLGYDFRILFKTIGVVLSPVVDHFHK